MSKLSIIEKWFKIIDMYNNFSGLTSKNVKLPKEMLEALCYYAEFVALQETDGYIKNGHGDHSQLPSLLIESINKYIEDNNKKLEIIKSYFDILSNDICFELSNGTIRYLNGGNPISYNKFEIDRYFPENFINFYKNYNCEYNIFIRDVKLNNIIN